MSWNYRVCTHVFSYKKAFLNKKLAENKDIRIFAVHSVYYDKGGMPDGSGKLPENLGGFESLEDLKNNVDKVQEAFKKPILDLDNWPNEWKDYESNKTEENSE